MIIWKKFMKNSLCIIGKKTKDTPQKNTEKPSKKVKKDEKKEVNLDKNKEKITIRFSTKSQNRQIKSNAS